MFYRKRHCVRTKSGAWVMLDRERISFGVWLKELFKRSGIYVREIQDFKCPHCSQTIPIKLHMHKNDKEGQCPVCGGMF